MSNKLSSRAGGTNSISSLRRKMEQSRTFSASPTLPPEALRPLTDAELGAVLSGRGTTIDGSYETNSALFPWRARGYGWPGKLRRMLDNPIIRSGVDKVLDTVTSLDWDISAPKNATKRERVQTELITDLFLNLDGGLNQFLRNIFSQLVYGFALFELVWTVDDDLIKWPTRQKYIAPWTVHSWAVDENEELRGVWQKTRSKGLVFLPIEKLAFFPRHFTGENFEGESALRSLYFVERAYSLCFVSFQIALERAGEGTLFAESRISPSDISLIDDQQLDDLEAAAQQFFSGESSYVIPHPLWKWDFKQAVPDAPANWLDHLSHTMSRQLGDVIVDFGSKGQGSYAAAESISGETQKQLTGICKSIATRIEQQLIAKIYEVNGWPDRRASVSVSGFRDDIFLSRLITAAGNPNVGFSLSQDQWEQIFGI